MARRVALLMFVTFMAGSSVNWSCLVECIAPDAVGAEETCHQTSPDGPRLTTGDDCNGERPRVSPFVRTDAFAVAITAALPEAFAVPLMPRLAGEASFVAVDAGPPCCRAVIPLRI